MAGEDRKKFDVNASRRALDLYAAAEFAVISERLKALEERNAANAKRIEEVYGEIFGGPHGQVGLSETLRSLIRRWGMVAAGVASLIGATPWIIDRFTSLANKPFFPSMMNKEQEWQLKGGKRMKAWDTKTGQWEYFYPEYREKK